MNTRADVPAGIEIGGNVISLEQQEVRDRIDEIARYLNAAQWLRALGVAEINNADGYLHLPDCVAVLEREASMKAEALANGPIRDALFALLKVGAP